MQMQEKDMVNDYLSMLNSSLAGYANVIAQAENQQLRQTVIQLRNQDESRQYALYKVAEQKGYYQPAQQAQPQEIQQVKSQFTQQQMQQ